jgi:hypothetical protein
MDRLRELIDRGRVLCLCGRVATGTTDDGVEPECDDPGCHAAELARLRAENRDLRATVERYRAVRV